MRCRFLEVNLRHEANPVNARATKRAYAATNNTN
jgi:hypothetical protein